MSTASGSLTELEAFSEYSPLAQPVHHTSYPLFCHHLSLPLPLLEDKLIKSNLVLLYPIHTLYTRTSMLWLFSLARWLALTSTILFLPFFYRDAF